jgi:hypothetical protein
MFGEGNRSGQMMDYRFPLSLSSIIRGELWSSLNCCPTVAYMGQAILRLDKDHDEVVVCPAELAQMQFVNLQ